MSTPRCYVYIMANPWTLVLHTGVTSNIERRVSEHKGRAQRGFTQKYNVTSLVYVEEHDGLKAAIEREKQIKGWSREKKLELIRSMNPDFADLAAEWHSGVRSEPDSSVALGSLGMTSKAARQ